MRPFPAKAVCRALQNIKAVGVMDRSDTFSSRGGPLYSEITSTLYENKKSIPVADYIFGLGGREIDPRMIETIFNQLLHIMNTQRVDQPVNYIGVRCSPPGADFPRINRLNSLSLAVMAAPMISGSNPCPVPWNGAMISCMSVMIMKPI
ncbi:MAG: hypothetical protein K9J51_10895 [Desulfotignum sp.]|nr:hypothetical protein [Desulfotignum sp.]